LSHIDPLPTIQTKKEFMDVLTVMITPPKLEETVGEKRGRPKELKSFLIENNTELTPSFQFGETVADIKATGVDSIKILTLQTTNRRHVQFYLDVSDPEQRFLVLHTNFDSDDTHDAISRLIYADELEFDSAWLSTNFLKNVSKKIGNRHSGYKISSEDIFQRIGEDEIVPDNVAKLEGSGGIADRILRIAEGDPSVKRNLGYEYVTITRGQRNYGVLDDLRFDGQFMVRKGKSVGDHMVLVETTKDDYSSSVKEIENQRLSGRKENGFSVIEGVPFEFEFSREVDDWEFYLTRIFNGKEPFRIWGMKSKIRDGYYRILGVDMHTGHPLDIEATNHVFRVYIPKGTCGNVVKRFFVNLQRCFDSTTSCPQLSA
jgi:hypothetical protein